jgi:hypothetical protein
MSWKAMIWTHKLRVQLSSVEYRTLMVLAEHAHEDGRGAYPAVMTIAEHAEMSVRSVQRSLRVLENRDVISLQNPATHSRSAVWRLNMSLDIVASVTPPALEQGCQLVHLGVPTGPFRGASVASEPKIEPKIEPKQQDRIPKAAAKRTHIAVDWTPGPADREYADNLGIPESQVSAFVDYHLANGTLMASWPAAWRTWCRNCTRFGTATGKPNKSQEEIAFDGNDAWGAEAWAASLPDAKTGKLQDETEVLTLGGIAAAWTARDCCEAAGFPASWRGDLSPVAHWLRDRLEPDEVIEAIRTSTKPNKPVLTYFDRRVREKASVRL